MVAKWRDGAGLKSDVSYKIINMSGESQSVIDAVEAGVNEWDTSGVYTLAPASDSQQADITIEVYKKVTPGYILGYTVPECSTDGHLSHAYIALGVSGLGVSGVTNLAAHEVGHGLGLGHADLSKDLMGPSLDSKERKNLTCLSNLDVGGLGAETSPYSVPDWSCLA
jgi:predicted Zn-dependent protease